MLLDRVASWLGSFRRGGCRCDTEAEEEWGVCAPVADHGAVEDSLHRPAWPDDLDAKASRARGDSSLSDLSTTFTDCSWRSTKSMFDCDGEEKQAPESVRALDEVERDLSAVPGGPSVPGLLAEGKPDILSIRACSWNLNGNLVDDQDNLSHWLEGGSTDVLVVGVQELIELNPRSVLRSWSGNRSRRAAFEERIEEVVAHQGSYKKVCSYGMVGLAIFVYVREELVPFTRDIEMKSIKTGFMGMVGNKGAVCVRLRIGELKTCFVNVHLASGSGKVKKRDKQLSNIFARLFREVQSEVGYSPWLKRALSPGRCHFTAVLGDFNSRLDLRPEVPLTKGNEGMHTVGRKPAEAPVDDWIHKDEMLNSRFESLEGFSEGPVLFPPTFGYMPGSDAFGRRYHPAWCDRVLCRTAAGARAMLQDYDAFLDVRHTSDHRPVAAHFQVSLGH